MHMGVLTPFSPSISLHFFRFCLLTWKKMFPLSKSLLALRNPVSFSWGTTVAFHLSSAEVRQTVCATLGSYTLATNQIILRGMSTFPFPPSFVWVSCSHWVLETKTCSWQPDLAHEARSNKSKLSVTIIQSASLFSVISFSCKKTNKRWFICVSIM